MCRHKKDPHLLFQLQTSAREHCYQKLIEEGKQSLVDAAERTRKLSYQYEILRPLFFQLSVPYLEELDIYPKNNKTQSNTATSVPPAASGVKLLQRQGDATADNLEKMKIDDGKEKYLK